MTCPKKIDVAILFEKAVRELDVACAVKSLLVRAGLSVEIFQNGNEYRKALGYSPAVAALPFCYQERSNNIYLNRWRDAAFFNLSWEQLFYPGNAKAKTPRGRFALQHVIHHAWSEYYANFLRGLGVPEERVYLNGNPSLALYQEPYRGFFRGRSELAAEAGLDPAKRWIFFPENYNWAFYEDGMLKQMVADGQTPEEVETMRAAVKRSFEKAMRWCARLCEDDGVELILRPRPATPPKIFLERVVETLGKVPKGMRISADGTVREWVMSSDMAISSYSTTLIEAASAGKPVALVEPEPLPSLLRQEWHGLLPHLQDEAEFLRFCRAAAPAGGEALGSWAKSVMLAHGDPIRNLAERLLALRRGEVPRPKPPSLRDITLTEIKGAPWQAQYLLRQARWAIHMARPPKKVADEYKQDMECAKRIDEKVALWNGSIPALVPSVQRSENKESPLK